MGVVKNLIVRIGADVRGLVNGMDTSSSATARASENIKKSTTDLKKNTKQNFGDARKSVREYSQYVANLKQAHQSASQSIPMLKDKLSQVESVYQSVKTATAGLDLSKPLEEQILEAENNLVKIERNAKKVEKQIAALGNSRSRGSSAKLDALQRELSTLGEKSRNAQLRLEYLNQIADNLGTSRIHFASDAGLKTLAADVTNARKQLQATEAVANETGQKLRSMGVAPTLKFALKSIGKEAAAAAGGGVKKLWQGLKDIAGKTVEGIASVPGRLLNIGKSAAAGSGGIGKMVKSIRNIGIASLALRVASGIFGQLRSIISNYISQNAALNASVTSLKNQMGEALAPAIHLVLAAFQRLMPIVTAVANAINSIFTALFGNISATTAGIQASAAAAGSAADSLETYGFDQITKVSEPSGGGAGGSLNQNQQTQEQSAIIQRLTGWITELKNAFKKGDWKGVGKVLGDGVNSALGAVASMDFGPKAKELVDNIAETIGSFIDTVDWNGILGGLTDAISYTCDTLSGYLADTDWFNLGDSLAVLVENGFYVDWKGLAKSIFKLLGSALGATVSTLCGFLNRICTDIGDYFSKKISESGGDVAQGLWEGIKEGLGNIGSWIKTNILDPFVEGFKEAFDIHSPSRVLEALGKLLIDGLYNGLLGNWSRIIEAVRSWAEDIKRTFSGAWSDCKETVSQKWSDISGTVKAKSGEIQLEVAGAFTGVKKSIVDKLTEAWLGGSAALSSLETDAAGVWEKLRSKASTAASNIASGVTSGFWNMKSGVVSVFESMYSGIKVWINNIIGGIERMINTIVSGLNNLIAKFNNNSLISLVDKYAGIKIKLSLLSGVTLPRLAKGTIVDGPTAAIVGESGKEAVMPLENHTGWIDNLADRIAARNGGSGVPMILQIYIGKRKLTDYVIQDINQITDTTGVCPIHV